MTLENASLESMAESPRSRGHHQKVHGQGAQKRIPGAQGNPTLWSQGHLSRLCQSRIAFCTFLVKINQYLEFHFDTSPLRQYESDGTFFVDFIIEYLEKLS